MQNSAPLQVVCYKCGTPVPTRKNVIHSTEVVRWAKALIAEYPELTGADTVKRIANNIDLEVEECRCGGVICDNPKCMVCTSRCGIDELVKPIDADGIESIGGMARCN